MPKFGGKLPKLGKLMEALILAGLIQVAQEAQDVLRGGGGIQHSGVRRRFTVLVGIGQY